MPKNELKQFRLKNFVKKKDLGIQNLKKKMKLIK